MAWTALNPVAIGDPTKKAHYDSLWDNFAFVYDFIGARSIYLFEAAAPTGWSIIAGCGDGLVAIKGGADAYNVAGGTKLAGTWTQANHVHARTAHVHTGAGLAITEATMASHTHNLNPYGATMAAGTYFNLSGAAFLAELTVTGDTGGSPANEHDHQATSGGTADSAGSASAATWRPLACVGILVSKDV